MKVLIIRFSSIGDIVLTTPVIRCVKQQVPGVEVHFLTKMNFGPVLAHNPYIDRLHLLQEDWDSLLQELRQVRFDEVVDLHHNIRSWRVKRALGLPVHAFYKLNLEKWLMVNLKWNWLPEKHIVDRYLATVKHLGVKNDGQGLDYFIPAEEQVAAMDLPASHQAGFIGVVIGAAHATKRLPPERLKILCQKINHPILLLGGKEDAADGDFIAAADPAKIYNACGKFPINGSADLVRRARLIISHDTGLMHIAAAFKKPLISIWGNTIPEFGMYPYYGASFSGKASLYDVVENKQLFCRPCSKIGFNQCPRGHFKCMNDLDLNLILDLVEKRLGAR